MAERTRACRHYLGAEGRYCGETGLVRLYIVGLRCPAHTPAALAGKPEPGQSSYGPPRRVPVRSLPARTDLIFYVLTELTS